MFANKTFRRFAAVAATFLVAALVFAPGATAQQASLIPGKATINQELIFPESGTGLLTIPFTYTLPPGFQLGGSAEPGIIVEFNKGSCPGYVQLVGPTTVLIEYPEAQATAQEGSFEFDVTLSRDAPGLTSITCSATLTAQAASGGTVDSVTSSSFDFTVKADYYSLLQVKVDKKVEQSAPYKDVQFPLQLSNFGNARTQLSFEIANQPTSGKWQVTVPENIILESPNTGTGSPNDVAIVTITTTYKTGWNNEQGAFQVLIRPTSADQPDKVGNTLSANMLVKVRGVYVPGFEPIVMLGALGAAGFVARMRRDADE